MNSEPKTLHVHKQPLEAAPDGRLARLIFGHGYFEHLVARQADEALLAARLLFLGQDRSPAQVLHHIREFREETRRERLSVTKAMEGSYITHIDAQDICLMLAIFQDLANSYERIAGAAVLCHPHFPPKLAQLNHAACEGCVAMSQAASQLQNLPAILNLWTSVRHAENSLRLTIRESAEIICRQPGEPAVVLKQMLLLTEFRLLRTQLRKGLARVQGVYLRNS